MTLNIIIDKVQIRCNRIQSQQIYCSFNFPQLLIGQVQKISSKISYVFVPIQKIIVCQKIHQEVKNQIRVSIWKYEPHSLIKEQLFELSQIISSNRRNIYRDIQWEFKFQLSNIKNNGSGPSQFRSKDVSQMLTNVPKAIVKVKSNADLLKKVIQNVSNIPKIIESVYEPKVSQARQQSRQQNSLTSKSHHSVSLIKRSLKNSINQLKNLSQKYSIQSKTQRQRYDYGISSSKTLNTPSKRLDKSDLKSFYDSCLSQAEKQQCKKMSSIEVSHAILSQYGLSLSNLNEIKVQNTISRQEQISIKNSASYAKAEQYPTEIVSMKTQFLPQNSQDKKIQFSKRVKKGLTDRNQNRDTLNLLINDRQQHQPRKIAADKLRKYTANKTKQPKQIKKKSQKTKPYIKK